MVRARVSSSSPAFAAGGILLVVACAGTGIPTTAGPAGPAMPGAAAPAYSIVPWPRVLEPRAGEFRPDPGTRVVLSDPSDPALQDIAGLLSAYVHAATGRAVPVGPAGTAPGARAIRLAIVPEGEEEGYRLRVEPESVTVSARTAAGIFYGTQTLRQLLTENGGIQAVEIEDAPRFRYRGMHLDVARHFFPPDFIRKYIDLLALYKFNTFHWHLTDDQGWRVEVRRYPLLTGTGACRDETRVGHARQRPEQYDGVRYCGHYTQDEVREIVAYAAARHVRIIPEIEMPGHATAAIAAYPHLACTDGPFRVVTTWGIFPDIFCPTEETFDFLEGVLTEVMELFPGEYIHIGGDEAPKRSWQESPIAQDVMRREGLADEHELQSWFIRRIERFLNAHGRKLIGWDEIAEGGLSPTATVMYWRDRSSAGLGHGPLTEDPARLAARSGNDVVMTPNQVFYLDHYQAYPPAEPLGIGGYTPIEQVYAYEPVPADFTPAMAERVIGAQANVWTEYIRTPGHVEYMALPRMLAVAEAVWSPAEARDFASFTRRLPAQLRLLDALGVNYRAPRPGEPGGPAVSDDAPLATPRIIGYLGSWGVRSKGLRIREIPGNRLTHIFYAFGRVGPDGLAALGDPCLDTGECGAAGRPAEIGEGGNFEQLRVLKRRYGHLNVLISLGGWTGSAHFSDAALTADGRRRLVASTLDVFLRPWPDLFDGIDVDWEFPVAGGERGNVERPEDRGNYTLLLEEYRRQLDELGAATGRRYELSIAASARPHQIANLELDRLPAILDYINVMTYDYAAGASKTHFNSPLRAVTGDPAPHMNVEASMRMFTDAGVPRHQLVLGAPFYGRTYGGVASADDGLFQRGDPRADTGWGRGSIDYRVLREREPERHGFTRRWHPEAQVPWLYNPATRVWISYDDPQSIAAKAEYVRAERFGGIMFWELGADDGSLLRAIHEGLGLRLD
jgi:hexosaminidase